MKVVHLNASLAERKSVVGQLQDDICDLLSKFIAENGELPLACAVGVLEVLKHNLIEGVCDAQ